VCLVEPMSEPAAALSCLSSTVTLAEKGRKAGHETTSAVNGLPHVSMYPQVSPSWGKTPAVSEAKRRNDSRVTQNLACKGVLIGYSRIRKGCLRAPPSHAPAPPAVACFVHPRGVVGGKTRETR
jgi:hypothetical protein